MRKWRNALIVALFGFVMVWAGHSPSRHTVVTADLSDPPVVNLVKI